MKQPEGCCGRVVMDKLELVKVAMRELGNVSAQDLSSFIAKTHGVMIEPKYIPMFRASVRRKEPLNAARQAAREAAERTRLRALAG
jgi:hypothetical protein